MFDMFDKAFAINMMRKAIQRKKHIPRLLRTRPPVARAPCRLAEIPRQRPRMLSNGEKITTCVPFSPKPWTISQPPRKKDRGPRKPKSMEKFAIPLPTA